MDELFAILQSNPDPGALTRLVSGPDSGAIDLFIGTVRNQTGGRAVVALEFESYGPMAKKEMAKIAEEAKSRWPVNKIAIHHLEGRALPGDTVVVIAVAAAHRAAAFEACRFAIDQLKERVPIWKKELYEDGEVWVAAHP